MFEVRHSLRIYFLTDAKRKHMMTSIINHSNGWITDERPPEAVRAINRRAVEDPEPRYA